MSGLQYVEIHILFCVSKKEIVFSEPSKSEVSFGHKFHGACVSLVGRDQMWRCTEPLFPFSNASKGVAIIHGPCDSVPAIAPYLSVSA